MAKKNPKNSGLSGGEKVGIGVALTTAAVAAAGAYFLYGSPNASKNRKKVKGWMLRAKGEVLQVLESAGNLTMEEYAAAVEKIAAGYSNAKDISQNELDAFKKEMMAYWKKIASGSNTTKKKAKKTVKKVAKKSAKKTSKK